MYLKSMSITNIPMPRPLYYHDTNFITGLVCASGSRHKGHIIPLEQQQFPGKKGSGYEKCQGIYDSKRAI